MALGNDAEIGLSPRSCRPTPNCSNPESRDARYSATYGSIKKMMNMHSLNTSLESYAGPDKATSAVQLEELRNIRRASSILHYPRARLAVCGSSEMGLEYPRSSFLGTICRAEDRQFYWKGTD